MRAVSNGALKGDALPTRLKVLDWGTSPSTKGDVILDDLTVLHFDASQKAIGRSRVPLDFEHNTVPGTDEFQRTSEPRPVAAYGAPRLVPGDGLWLEDLAWTPEGQKSARNFEDLSPAPFRTEEGRVIGLHSVALTRAGAVDGLHFFSASPEIDAMLTTLSAALTPMETKTTDAPETFSVAELAAALGVAEATKPSVLARLTALSALPDLKSEIVALKASAVDPARITAALAPLSARLDSMEAAQKTQREALESTEREQLIARFAAEGKVPRSAELKTYSADDMRKLDNATLKLLLANTAATVPLSARGKMRETSGRDDTLKGRARVIAAFERETSTRN